MGLDVDIAIDAAGAASRLELVAELGEQAVDAAC